MALPSLNLLQLNDFDRTYQYVSSTRSSRQLPNDEFGKFAESYLRGPWFRISRTGRVISMQFNPNGITRRIAMGFRNPGVQPGWKIWLIATDKTTLDLHWENDQIRVHRVATHRFHDSGDLTVEFQAVNPRNQRQIYLSVNMIPDHLWNIST